VATRKKGIITPPTGYASWWVHLRPDGKKLFWKRERREQKKFILGEGEET